ncbi:MAG: RraA family protein [Actinomycetota bacterium]|nr:RraA family protein [Actinomycetota bacterium]
MTTSPAGPPVLVATVRHRPPDAVVVRFRNVSVATVSDAQERLWALDGGIRAMWSAATCVGPALPVYTRAGDNLAVHRALDIARPGDVLVVNGQGDTSRALLGGLLAARALQRGLAGVVVDGAVRDVDEIAAVGLPVFARASTPAGPYKHGPAEIGLPVACGGVVCSPGDIVCGDCDGVAVVPLSRAERVADAIGGILDKEQELVRRWNGSG